MNYLCRTPSAAKPGPIWGDGPEKDDVKVEIMQNRRWHSGMGPWDHGQTVQDSRS